MGNPRLKIADEHAADEAVHRLNFARQIGVQGAGKAWVLQKRLRLGGGDLYCGAWLGCDMRTGRGRCIVCQAFVAKNATRSKGTNNNVLPVLTEDPFVDPTIDT
ncbi:hypothetical protein GCM10007315_31430 [Gemmobacter tilapiae]|uniref:Uncharacterized protein n=1 Tax=Neogemmobacter tilapiae TaxID=875041 RepID=A0A918WMR3_9RHOB|nr:hypothetical protein GCM10007315_31430 [Gemmobacter tilapiae]